MAYLGETSTPKLWKRMKAYINNRLESLNIGVDYIVEQGTTTMEDGTVWEYVKRNSGYMELKGMRNGIITPNEFGSWGSYMKIAPITSRPFPFEFTELWDSNCHVWTVDGTSTMITGDLYNSGQQPTNTMTGQFVVMRPTAPSANLTVRVFFEAFGKWK